LTLEPLQVIIPSQLLEQAYSWLNIFATFTGIIGFIITIYVSIKVRELKEVQRTEREALSGAIGVGDIITTLRSTDRLLQKIQLSPECPDSFRQDVVEQRSKLLKEEGRIVGMTRTIQEYVSKHEEKPSSQSIRRFSKLVGLRGLKTNIITDYYCSEFCRRNISKAKRIVRILCVRNIRITEPDILRELSNRINDGCRVEIMSLSPAVDDCIIKDVMCTLPKPPADCGQFRNEVENNYKSISVFYKGLTKKQNFAYFEYNRLPNLHMCQFDDTIYLGFPYYYRKDTPKGETLLDFGIAVSESETIGKRVIEQFEELKRDSTDLLATRDDLFSV
jgi:hypothetical protein